MFRMLVLPTDVWLWRDTVALLFGFCCFLVGLIRWFAGLLLLFGIFLLVMLVDFGLWFIWVLGV